MMSKMTDNSFSLTDLYPKYVINSKGEKKAFEETSIAKILNKETGLDMHIAEDVAEDTIRKIIGLGMEEITTNYIRELVCVELTQRGLHKYRNLFARAINLENISFKLDDEFFNKFKNIQPDWGTLGYITYKRTYARMIETENRKEEFWETIRRVVEGCYSIQKELQNYVRRFAEKGTLEYKAEFFVDSSINLVSRLSRIIQKLDLRKYGSEASSILRKLLTVLYLEGTSATDAGRGSEINIRYQVEKFLLSDKSHDEITFSKIT